MTNFQKLIADLKKRDIIHSISNEDKVGRITQEQGAYIGFDPTAVSLHLGNYTQIVNLVRIKRAGYKAVGILGGATGMIGDPSFRSTERVLLDMDTLAKNKGFIRKQLEKFGLEVIDNYTFYENVNFLDFLRDAGKHFNVNYLLAKESVATRLSAGLTYTEFSYNLLQAWDFYRLATDHGIVVQLGGSDQWGNIISGVDLINDKARDLNLPSLAITTNLIVDEHGNKFSKSTGGGALWLDANLTSPYTLYQYLFNQGESIIEALLKQLCLEDLEVIEKVIAEHRQNTSLRVAQKFLADSVVRDIHGQEAVDQAQRISDFLFAKTDKISVADLEKAADSIPQIDFKTDLAQMLIDGGVVKSKRELNEFLSAGSININGDVLKSLDQAINTQVFDNKYLLIRRGKRNFYLAKI